MNSHYTSSGFVSAICFKSHLFYITAAINDLSFTEYIWHRFNDRYFYTTHWKKWNLKVALGQSSSGFDRFLRKITIGKNELNSSQIPQKKKDYSYYFWLNLQEKSVNIKGRKQFSSRKNSTISYPRKFSVRSCAPISISLIVMINVRMIFTNIKFFLQMFRSTFNIFYYSTEVNSKRKETNLIWISLRFSIRIRRFIK